MDIIITITVTDECVDPDHDTGLTNEGYEDLIDALQGAKAFGGVVDLVRA